MLLLLCAAGLFYSGRQPAAGVQESGEKSGGYISVGPPGAKGQKAEEDDGEENRSGNPPEDALETDVQNAKAAAVQPDVQNAEAAAVQPESSQVCESQEPAKIRVLIKTQDFQGEYHGHLSIVCNSATQLLGQNREFAAGERLEIGPDSGLFDENGILVLIPQDETAGFTVTSLQRAQGTPTYEGQLEIRREEEGLLLINEVELETYLCHVVPSEMPASYEKEALKAQAVCARTYACRQILDGALESKHADVDDSVSFQVYNNVERQERTDQAVAETAGVIMTCDQEPITAYFFSTSSGYTSTNEVWAQTPEKYLQCVDLGDLESAEPWYRWSVSLPAAYLNDRISPYGIGTLTGLEILKRSQGGAVEELRITGTEGEAVLNSEYKIRQLLSTEGYPITRGDGSVVTDMSLMPSAYFSCRPVAAGQETEAWLFEGGGYGHGVGMSQNGANRLAEQGKDYKEILEYFYTEIDLCSIS